MYAPGAQRYVIGLTADFQRRKHHGDTCVPLPRVNQILKHWHATIATKYDRENKDFINLFSSASPSSSSTSSSPSSLFSSSELKRTSPSSSSSSVKRARIDPSSGAPLSEAQLSGLQRAILNGGSFLHHIAMNLTCNKANPDITTRFLASGIRSWTMLREDYRQPLFPAYASPLCRDEIEWTMATLAAMKRSCVEWNQCWNETIIPLTCHGATAIGAIIRSYYPQDDNNLSSVSALLDNDIMTWELPSWLQSHYHGLTSASSCIVC